MKFQKLLGEHRAHPQPQWLRSFVAAAEPKQLIVRFENAPCLLHGDFAEFGGCRPVRRSDEQCATNQALQSFDL